MSVWSVAAAQSSSHPADIARNLSHHLNIVHQAAEHQVDLLVFPELSLTGYELAQSPELAMSIHDPRLDAFSRAASDNQMSIVVGLPLNNGEETLLSALAFLADGTRLAYGKRNLFGEEKAFFTAGHSVPLFGFPQHQVALAVCADISVEEYARDAALRGANLYAAGVVVSDAGYEKDCAYLAGWSRTWQLPSLMANHATPTGGYQCAGKSAFWNAQGERVVQGGEGEQLVIARRVGNDWQGEVHSLRYAPDS